MDGKGEEALDAVLFLCVALLVFRNTGRVVTTIVGGCRSLKSVDRCLVCNNETKNTKQEQNRK